MDEIHNKMVKKVVELIEGAFSFSSLKSTKGGRLVALLVVEPISELISIVPKKNV